MVITHAEAWPLLVFSSSLVLGWPANLIAFLHCYKDPLTIRVVNLVVMDTPGAIGGAQHITLVQVVHS